MTAGLEILSSRITNPFFSFSSGGIDVVTLLIPDFAALRWIELEPWHELKDGEERSENAEDGPKASWKLRSVSAAVGLDGAEVTRVVDQRIFEGAPLRIGLSDIILLGTLTYRPSAEPAEGGSEAPEPKPESVGRIQKQRLRLKQMY